MTRANGLRQVPKYSIGRRRKAIPIPHNIMADVTVYVKAFLHPSHRVPPDLGLAIKLHVEDPDRKCPTAKFLYYLLTHSPAPKGITNEILRECEFNDFVRPVGMSRVVFLKSSP